MSFFMMRLFKKANVEAWKAWVPIANYWTFFKLGGYPGALSLLTYSSLVVYSFFVIYYNIFGGFFDDLALFLFIGLTLSGSILYAVFLCMAAYQIGRKLYKDGVMVLLFVFLSPVWMGICGLDRSVWDDSRGRPSLIPGTPTSGGYGYGYAGYGGYYQQQPYQQSGAYPPQGSPYQQPALYQQPGAYPSQGAVYQQPGVYQQPAAYPPPPGIGLPANSLQNPQQPSIGAPASAPQEPLQPGADVSNSVVPGVAQEPPQEH
jgi:hypothetical protein